MNNYLFPFYFFSTIISLTTNCVNYYMSHYWSIKNAIIGSYQMSHYYTVAINCPLIIRTTMFWATPSYNNYQLLLTEQ